MNDCANSIAASDVSGFPIAALEGFV